MTRAGAIAGAMADACSSRTSVAEVSRLVKSIDDLTQCSICSDTLASPKLLPCFHAFCLACLQKCFGPGAGPGAEPSCPLCRRVFALPTGGLDALPAHFFVEHLIDALNISRQLAARHRCDVCCDDDDDDDDESQSQFATGYCGQCAQFLCDRCAKYDWIFTARRCASMQW